jgi:mono/diheme cytochrome c family protein
MKPIFLIPAVLAASLAVVSVANAGGHEIPTAPADFLVMENPFAEDMDDAKLIKKAGRLYKRKCKKCHGGKGNGKGSSAADLEIKPPVLNAPGYMDSRKDGQLFYILSKGGSEDAEMNAYGPGTDANLSDERMWKLITYMRAKFTH